MKITLTISAIAIAAAVLCARGEDLTVKGQTYKDATITRTEPDGIVVTHSAGIVKLRFTELSAELQKKYGYNPAAAAKYSAEADAAQRRLDETASAARSSAAEKRTGEFEQTERVNRERAAQRAAHQAAVDRVSKITPREVVELRISQATEDGALAFIDNGDEPVFLRGFKNAVDGDRYQNQTLYPCGTYRYQSVVGAMKTVHAYALSAQAAVAFFESSAR